MATKKQRVILSLGGSMLVPNSIDDQFIASFVRFVQKHTATHSFVIFCGGGKTARNYQQALDAQGIQDAESKDWVGIQASVLNATLLVHSFQGQADSAVITDPRVRLSWRRSVYIGAGWKPGRSTDYDAVRLAAENDIPLVINISNIDYVYDSDPRSNPKARKLTQVSWVDMRKIVGDTWNPGMNVPFDPIAAKLAQKEDITVRFVNGAHMQELRNAVLNTSFQGTEISSSHPNLL